jgi:hypothetical protein
MQIKIEIDLKPEELRRFLGLPDVAGLQEDVIAFLRDKIGTASENFDPASFVKDNLETLRRPWKKIVEAAKARAASLVPEPEPAPAPKKRAPRKAAAKKRPRHKPAPAHHHRPEPAAAEAHQAREAEAAEPAAPAAGDNGGQD